MNQMARAEQQHYDYDRWLKEHHEPDNDGCECVECMEAANDFMDDIAYELWKEDRRD